MPRSWLQKYLPTDKQMRNILGMPPNVAASARNGAQDGKWTAWISDVIADPALWHLNRRTVAGAVAVGLFIAWLPIPMQMLVAALLAAVLRVHMPISVMLVWLSNPITVAPLLYASGVVGSTVLGTDSSAFSLSGGLHDLLRNAVEAWPTLLFGSIFMGALSAVLGYITTKLIWRFIAIRRWQARAERASSLV